MKDIEKIKNSRELIQLLQKHKRLIHTGNLAEFWCEQLCNIKLANISNQKGFDGTTKKGEKVEIKFRANCKGTPKGMKIDLSKITYIYYVMMDEDLLPAIIYRYHKKNISKLNNGRVSFHNAHLNNKFEVVYRR